MDAGALDDTGTGGGAKYSVNVPLQEGMDDASYQLIFQPVMAKVPAANSVRWRRCTESRHFIGTLKRQAFYAVPQG